MDGQSIKDQMKPSIIAEPRRRRWLRADSRPKPPSVAEGGTPVDNSKLSEEELDQITADIVAALKTVYDPEIPSDIYELGLIYKIDVSDEREVAIEMTLTAPGCPVAGEMPIWVENAVNSVPGVKGHQGHADLRSALGQGPDVGRSATGAEYVLSLIGGSEPEFRPYLQTAALHTRRSWRGGS